MSLVYSCFLSLWLLMLLPRLVKKKYRSTILYRLGIKRPLFPKKERGEFRVWIHAVSLGETKAVAPLIDKLLEENKEARIFFSSSTQTGLDEAKRQNKARLSFLLPLDFQFLMRWYVQRVDPDLFILVESDFWFHLLSELKAHGAKIFLVNGKMSESSYQNFKKVPSFTKALFSYFDHLCLQSEEFFSRFQNLGIPPSKLSVMGNMKFDALPPLPSNTPLIFPQGTIILIASTHETEEEKILTALAPLFPDETRSFLIAPRHPERFASVEKLLRAKNLPMRRIKEGGRGDERFILVDQMGLLDLCFEKASLVILGGSFIDGIGGHNLYEPIRFGLPILYGPYMYKQNYMVEKFRQHNIGAQVSLDELKTALPLHLNNRPSLENLHALRSEIEGATLRTFSLLTKFSR